MDRSQPPARRWADVCVWGALALVACGHWLLFAEYVRREVAWCYASHYDQTTLLYLAHLTYERIGRNGPVEALAHALRTLPPIGATLHLEAVLSFLLTRPSRLAALRVNWLHFVLLNLAVVTTLRARVRGWALPALALGLVWSMATTFWWAGGLDDFRLDFAACCLYGTFLALVLRSEMFRHRGWSLAAGALGTWCVLTRSLTSVYFGGLLALWIAVLSWRLLRERDLARRQDRRRALGGAALSAGCLILVALPSLAFRARSLWSYYVVGHVTGRESAVHAERAGRGGLEVLAYYPASLMRDHAGLSFVCLAAGCLVVLALARRPTPRPAEPAAFPGEAFGFVAAAVAVPLAALTADTAKSPLVGSILVTPLLWTVLLAAARLAPRARPAALWFTVVASLAVGSAFQVARLTGPAPWGSSVEARLDVVRLHDDMVRLVREQGWTQPEVLADRKRDYVPALHVSAYERHRILLNVRYLLAPILWKPATREVVESLRRSHFVILTAPGPLPETALPYDHKMAELEPRLRGHCTRRLSLVGTYHVPEEIHLYARLDAPEKNERGGVDRRGIRSTLQ